LRYTGPVSAHRTQLASTASSLDELIARVTAAADDLSGGTDDDVAADLYEVGAHSRRVPGVWPRSCGGLAPTDRKPVPPIG